MRQDKLREVLLVKAIEEADATGTLIPFADRARASREAMKGIGLATDQISAAGESAPEVSQALGARAEQLLRPLVKRHLMLEDLLARSGWPTWIGGALIVAAGVCGFGLSALHGSRHINILALPLLGLLAWNVVVYLVMLGFVVRDRVTDKRPRLAGSSMRAIGRRLGPIVARVAQADSVLAPAVRGFVSDWSNAAAPVLAQQLKFWLHVSAATVAATFAIGLYLRGLVFHFDAVWESTFLDASRVQWLIDRVFGFVAWLSGITLPSNLQAIGELELHSDGSGGGYAAPWIHLMAWTMLCFVVVPRLVFGCMAWFSSERMQQATSLPKVLVDYAVRVLGAGGQGQQTVVSVIPFAFHPPEQLTDRIAPLLLRLFGRGARGRLQDEIKYGDEESVLPALDRYQQDSGGIALLMNLAATPESENHGEAIIAARDRARDGAVGMPFHLLVDEASYAERFATDTKRMEEQRALWRDFAHRHGVEAVFVSRGQV